MKKLGFTLAEVLITLAIVGLIAALTLPGLNSNVNNRRIGPALAKAINNLENANRMVLVEREIGTINELGNKAYIDDMADRLNAELDSTNAVIRGKDGITYTFGTLKQGGNASGSAKYTGQYFPVGIDINGEKQPNGANSDRFLVLIDTRGAVIPAGGAEFARYSASYPNTPCANGASVASNSGYGYCTASVMNAGWDVNYIVSKNNTIGFSQNLSAVALSSFDSKLPNLDIGDQPVLNFKDPQDIVTK